MLIYYTSYRIRSPDTIIDITISTDDLLRITLNSYNTQRIVKVIFVKDYMIYDITSSEEYIYIYIDSDLFVSFFKKNKYIPYSLELQYNIINNASRNNPFMFIHKEIEPIYTTEIVNFKFPIETRFYNYQLQNIKWMKGLENEADNSKLRLDLHNNLILDDSYYYDIINNTITMGKKTTEISFNGGMLFDEVGLGKTITTIGLCMTGVELPSHKEKKICKAKNKYGKNKNKTCKIKSIGKTGFCKKHQGIKTITREENLVIDQDGFFSSECNLVICPSHLCQQWKDEIIKVCPIINVKIISVMSQYKKYSYSEIANADFLIISYNMLVNDSYCSLFKNHRGIRSINKNFINIPHFENTRSAYVSNSTVEEASQTPLLFHCIKFKRIIYDEIQDILNNCKIMDMLYHCKAIKSRYTWCLSGTPFTYSEKNMLVYFYLLNTNKSIDCFYPRMDNYNFIYSRLYSHNFHNNILSSYFSSNLSRRNTLESVSKELKTLVVNNIVNFIEFSNTERSVYDNQSNREMMRRVCCHPGMELNRYNFNESESIQDIKDKIVSAYSRLVISNCQEIVRHQEIIRINEFSDQMAKLQSNIDSLYSSNEILNKKIEYLNRVYHYDYKNSEMVCMICMDDLYEDPSINLMIISCGHQVCKSCIEKYIQTIMIVKCPSCKQEIDINTSYILKNPSKSSRLDKYGTKLANILDYIDKVPQNEQVIVFIEWDHMIDIFYDIMKSLNYPVSHCKGNVFKRKNVINKFKKGDFKVLLLSLKNSATGTNLTEANHVLFMSPLDGSCEVTRGLEAQCIGRAERIGQLKQVNVVKFIVKNTIEEEILNGTF